MQKLIYKFIYTEAYIYQTYNLIERILCTAELTVQQGTYPAANYVIDYITIKNYAAV